MKRTVIAVAMLLLAAAGVADGATLWQSGTYAYDGQGNIRGIGSNVFYYDSVGRLKYGDAGTGRNQEYSYDDYGNLTSIRTDGGTAQSVAVDPATNRLKQTGGNIIGTHDAEGNLTEYLGGASSFAYDRLGSVTRSTVDGVQRIHIYTASDERIASITVNNAAPIRTEVTLRDPSARVLRRYATNGGLSATWSWEEDYVYRDSALLAAELPSSERRHFHPDHLGTPRLITDGAGNTVAVHAYYPFGEEATDPLQDTERSKFTGHERDAKTLDYMHARYYNARMGRLLSVDPIVNVKASIPRPQLWNRYSYAANNPMKLVDRDGKWASIVFHVHQDAIDTSLPFVDENRRAILRSAQERVDLDQTNQYKHAMSLPGQPVEDARAQAQAFVNTSMEKAIEHELAGNTEMAMEHLGAAIHTLQDATSPSHAGFQVFDPSWSATSPQVRDHVMAETRDPGVSFGTGRSLNEVTFGAWVYLPIALDYRFRSHLSPIQSAIHRAAL